MLRQTDRVNSLSLNQLLPYHGPRTPHLGTGDNPSQS